MAYMLAIFKNCLHVSKSSVLLTFLATFKNCLHVSKSTVLLACWQFVSFAYMLTSPQYCLHVNKSKECLLDDNTLEEFPRYFS